MTIDLMAILATYLAAGVWYTHGILTDTADASAEDRSLVADGLYRLNFGAIVGIIVFISLWSVVFICSNVANSKIWR